MKQLKMQPCCKAQKGNNKYMLMVLSKAIYSLFHDECQNIDARPKKGD